MSWYTAIDQKGWEEERQGEREGGRLRGRKKENLVFTTSTFSSQDEDRAHCPATANIFT